MGQTYLSFLVKLGGRVLPALSSAPDMEEIEVYSLQMSHGERDSLPQEPLDSTLTVGIIPRQRANGRSSKRRPTLMVCKMQQNLSKSPGISSSPSFLAEMIHQLNLDFC